MGVLADLDEVAEAGRVDVLDYEQFPTANIFELRGFVDQGRRDAIRRIVARYNEIVTKVESDPSLKIEVR